MRKLFVTISSTAALFAAFSLNALNAQDTEVRGPVPNRANGGNPQSEVYRASDVMNMPVKDENGDEVGRIKDLVINGDSREVLYAVVSMNDAKEKDAFYIMPWTVFQPAYGRGNALQYTVLTIPQNVWIQAPFYTSTQWRTVAFSDWGPKVNSYYERHIPAGASAGSRSKTFNVNKPNLNREDNKGTQNEKQGNPSKETDKPRPRNNQNNEADQPKPGSKPERQPSTEKPRSKDNEPANEKPQVNPKEPAPAAKEPAPGSKEPIPAPKQPAPAPKGPAPSEPKAPSPNPK